MKTKHKHKDGGTMVSVTIETEPAVIDYQDILDACRVESDDWMPAPWDDCDGFEHEVIKDETDGEARGSFREDGGKMMRVVTDQFSEWGWAGKGASKQAQFEAHAAAVAHTLETIARWRASGWDCCIVVCEFKGCRDSLGGIYDAPDSDYVCGECKHRVAGEIVAQLEKEGFEVVNQPTAQDRRKLNLTERMRYNMQMQNWQGDNTRSNRLCRNRRTINTMRRNGGSK